MWRSTYHRDIFSALPFAWLVLIGMTLVLTDAEIRVALPSACLYNFSPLFAPPIFFDLV